MVDEKYDLFKQAEKDGYCQNCGWIDGDGVKECYYDKEIGSVTHQNTKKAYRRHLTESQLQLDKNYGKYESGVLDKVTKSKVVEYFISKKDENRIKFYETKLTLEDYLKKGYVIVDSKYMTNKEQTVFEDYKEDIIQYSLNKHHSDNCKGFAYLSEPYHIKCTECDTEIKLWEHGIDYDVG